MRRNRAATGLLVCLLAVRAASAGDGVLEIGATCATSTGCFSGDTPGYPVTISASGSYRLTSNLELTDANQTAILVSANDVSIDLAGFRIHGPNRCPGFPATCTLTGSGSGVAVTNTATVRGVSVSGGSVVGMAAQGIRLGTQASVRFVRASQNAVGISVTQGSIFGCIAFSNGTTGVFAASGSIADLDLAEQNGGEGFSLGNDSSVSRSSAVNNAEQGFALGSRSRIEASTAFTNNMQGVLLREGAVVSTVGAYINLGNGIETGAGSSVESSIAGGNSGAGYSLGIGSTIGTSTAARNTGAGIATGTRSLVRGNSASDNTGAGLLLSDDSAYRENVIASNDGGTVLINGAGTFSALGGNYCTDSTGTPVACP